MAKRLPRTKLTLGLYKTGMIRDKTTMLLVDRRLKDPKTARAMNDLYTLKRGSRWVGRLGIWGKWLFQNRDAIFQILGLVVMFMDDGTEVVMDKEEAEAWQAAQDAEKKAASKKDSTKTPDGEKVEDFANSPLEPEVQAVIDSQLDAIDEQKASYDIGIGVQTVQGPALTADGCPAHWALEDEHDEEDCNDENDECDDEPWSEGDPE